jgi:hypothetical protein
MIGNKVQLCLGAHSVENSGLVPVTHTKLEAERIALELPAHEPVYRVSLSKMLGIH